MGALFGLLKVVEYNFFVRNIPLELYIGLIALGFVVLGIWAGQKLARPKVIKLGPDFEIDEEEIERLGISRREYEVLELIAEGLSNQEIADRMFVSPSTVKTHTSNLFAKLDARRRTQAVQIAKELHLIR